MRWLWQIARNLAFAVVVVSLSLTIYYLLGLGRRGEPSVLASLLESAGNKALAMVREPDERQRLEVLYQRFLDRVRRGQVSAEWVERIASDVLNLSYGARDPEDAAESLRRSLVVAQNAPQTAPRKSEGEPDWDRLTRKVRAAERVMAYWHLRTSSLADSSAHMPIRLEQDLTPTVDSTLVAKLRALEERQRQLEALRQERLQELEERRKLLDSLRKLIESPTLDTTGQTTGGPQETEPVPDQVPAQ